MSDLLSLWTPDLKPSISSDPWFPKVDMNSEEILVKDEWIFERKINESNPNWTLIETKSN
mgnify:CR=1 FL=1